MVENPWSKQILKEKKKEHLSESFLGGRFIHSLRGILWAPVILRYQAGRGGNDASGREHHRPTCSAGSSIRSRWASGGTATPSMTPALRWMDSSRDSWWGKRADMPPVLYSCVKWEIMPQEGFYGLTWKPCLTWPIISTLISHFIHIKVQSTVHNVPAWLMLSQMRKLRPGNGKLCIQLAVTSGRVHVHPTPLLCLLFEPLGKRSPVISRW